MGHRAWKLREKTGMGWTGGLVLTAWRGKGEQGMIGSQGEGYSGESVGEMGLARQGEQNWSSMGEEAKVSKRWELIWGV